MRLSVVAHDDPVTTQTEKRIVLNLAAVKVPVRNALRYKDGATADLIESTALADAAVLATHQQDIRQSPCFRKQLFLLAPPALTAAVTQISNAEC